MSPVKLLQRAKIQRTVKKEAGSVELFLHFFFLLYLFFFFFLQSTNCLPRLEFVGQGNKKKVVFFFLHQRSLLKGKNISSWFSCGKIRFVNKKVA